MRRTLLSLLLLLTSCQAAVLAPQGQVGLAERTILLDCVAIMLAIVIPTLAATLAFAWWFRTGNKRARRRPDFVFSGQLELLVWAIPLLTIMLLGGVTWVASHDLDPARKLAADQPPLEVQVVSLDWKWLFIYPAEHVASVNRLVLPAGRPVHFFLTSASVMNAFFIPQLGSMIYAMNGMSVQLNLIADRPGDFRGLSSHYSGDGFSDMHFAVQALPATGFEQWVRATASTGAELTAASYTELERQSRAVAPFTYRAVEPELYDHIVSQALPPAPGPPPSPNPEGAADHAG